MEVVLDAFEGPLDLLLHLIEKNEIDIYDIPISELTAQYIAVLHEQQNPMEVMSEFILMAATLLEIKSRMLLPKPPQVTGAEEEDPRDALVRKLLEYKRCQALAEQLSRYPEPGARLVREAERLSAEESLDPEALMEGVSLTSLWQVFSEVIKRRELRIDHVRAQYGNMPRERFTMEEKIAQIQQYVTLRRRFRLTELFETCQTREEMVVTFLALLEMIRQRWMRVRQNAVFGDIDCEANAENS